MLVKRGWARGLWPSRSILRPQLMVCIDFHVVTFTTVLYEFFIAVGQKKSPRLAFRTRVAVDNVRFPLYSSQ